MASSALLVMPLKGANSAPTAYATEGTSSALIGYATEGVNSALVGYATEGGTDYLQAPVYQNCPNTSLVLSVPSGKV